MKNFPTQYAKKKKFEIIKSEKKLFKKIILCLLINFSDHLNFNSAYSRLKMKYVKSTKPTKFINLCKINFFIYIINHSRSFSKLVLRSRIIN